MPSEPITCKFVTFFFFSFTVGQLAFISLKTLVLILVITGIALESERAK